MKKITAYKVFNPDWTCKGFQYEVGKTYICKEKLVMCETGFHACRKVSDCFSFYSFDPKNKVAEVELSGTILGLDESKQCASMITIIRELKWSEMLELANSGIGDSGYRNSGNRNSGDFNTNDPTIRMFNKETNLYRNDIRYPNYFSFDLCLWISFDSMTDDEKKQYPKAFVCNGYLKTLEYKEAWGLAFKKATQEEIEQTKKLPNFDAQIFFEITGIDYFMKNK